MVNNDNGKIVDVIDSRDKEDVIKWLKKFKNIKIVTRDGAYSYAYAITEALPYATQISDRFHLFQGLTDYASDEIRKLIPNVIKTEILSTREIKLNKKFKETTKYEQTKIDNFKRRKELVKQIQERYKVVENANQICREFKLNKRTVGRYLKANIEKMTIQNNAGFSKLDKYKDIIYDNIEMPAIRIYERSKSIGYKGAYGTVKNYINKIKRVNKGFVIKYITLYRKDILKLLFNKGINDLNIHDEEKESLKKYLKTNERLQEIINIITNFRIMMFAESKEKLDEWLIKTQSKNFLEINKFINGIYLDYEAVVNCVMNLEQSNGLAEGKITKIKSIKRTMYGRCKFNYLRSKVFLIG